MNRPRLGVAVLVTNNYDQLLLGRRNKEPSLGLWVIPGGGVELGETITQTALRELREETGITSFDEFDPQPVYVQEIIKEGWELEHRVILFVKAKVSYPRLTAGGDLIVPGFVPRGNRINDLSISPVCIPVLQSQGWLPN